MIVKMTKRATSEEVAAIESKLHDWGYKTGKMVGEEITLIGVYGDITRLPTGEVQEMGGVDSLIPISRSYKRVAQKGEPGDLIHRPVRIGAVEVGGDELTVIAGPCSVESETQIMEAARLVKESGAKALRGGVVKYRSSPYSGWEGIGSSSEEALRNGLKLIVKAGREFGLPTVVEVLDANDVSEEIPHNKGRGLLEPSVTEFRGRFFLTLRAEDNRGYVCASDDGLKWTPKQAWMWDDGEPLTLSTTQQHWLAHSDALWLVYTRKDPANVNVLRWRSPLFMAQVDTTTLRLLRESERVVLPLVGDGVKDPDRVAIMGNFHTTNVSPDESWVTVGEWQPKNGIKGDMLVARIRWSRPNALVK